MTKTEKLLICAKAVGHYIVPDYKAPDKPAVTVDGDIWIDTCSDKLRPQLYNPFTNDAQNRELEILLLKQGFGIWREKDNYVCGSHLDDILVRDKYLNNCVVNAVVAMGKEK